MFSLHGAHKRVLGKSVAAQLSGDLAAPQYDDARAHGEHVAGVGRREDDGETGAGPLGEEPVLPVAPDLPSPEGRSELPPRIM